MFVLQLPCPNSPGRRYLPGDWVRFNFLGAPTLALVCKVLAEPRDSEEGGVSGNIALNDFLAVRTLSGKLRIVRSQSVDYVPPSVELVSEVSK